MRERVCAVIPAAGRGTRLGAERPKILVEVVPGVSVWDILRERLTPYTSGLHVVLSPEGRTLFDDTRATVSVQETPTGMGGAIFGAAPFWRAYDAILVVWGDQVMLSEKTVARTLDAHEPGGLTIPLVALAEPYVEYEVDGGRLTRVLQSREGDVTRPGGLSDVGVFCLGTAGLQDEWAAYLAGAAPGARTGEVNFLPFLPWLSARRPFRTVAADDPDEARGVNTAEDLEFARRAYRR